MSSAANWNQGLFERTSWGTWRPVRGIHNGMICATCKEDTALIYRDLAGVHYCELHKGDGRL